MPAVIPQSRYPLPALLGRYRLVSRFLTAAAASAAAVSGNYVDCNDDTPADPTYPRRTDQTATKGAAPATAPAIPAADTDADNSATRDNTRTRAAGQVLAVAAAGTAGTACSGDSGG